MPYALKYSKTTMYADDTSLAYSAKSVSDISNVMNYELESLRIWLFSNKLSLNVAKTTSMLIGTRNRLLDKSNGNYIGQILIYQMNLLSKRHALNIWVYKLIAS